jgi:hypothetical protein
MSIRPTHCLRMLAAVVAAGAIHAAPAAAAADPDTTPPEITITVPAEGQVFDSSQGPVATSFACADEPGGSGVANCDGDATLDTTKHGDQTFTVHTTDRAGNETTRTVNYRVVDRIPPQITITAPTPGQHVPLHSTLSSSFGCTDDGGSLIYTCTGTQIIESPEPGPHVFTVVAIDTDGNRTTKSVPYVVDPTEAGGGGGGTGATGGTDLAAAANAALKASGSALKDLRRGSAKLSLSAPAGSSVSVRVTASVKHRTITIAKASGRAGGEALTLTLRPSGTAARKLLRAHRTLRLHVFVSIKDASGRLARKDKVIVVRA